MTDKPHFDISAAVVRQLGEELVSDEVTAIVELVKNAYDADASYASVVVDTNHLLRPEESFFSGTKGYVVIEDDGVGMDYSDIKRGWLTISLSAKRQMKQQKQKTAKGRTPLGDKGLGRLSTQRLGDQLDMFTRKEGSRETSHIGFSWRDFREDVALSVVPVQQEVLQNNTQKKGTRLVISGLRDPQVWKGDARSDLVRKLSQLIFPFGEVRPFRVYMTIDGERIDLSTIADTVREASVARFRITYVSGVLSVYGRVRLTRLRALGAENQEIYQRILSRDQGSEFYTFLASPSNRYAIPSAEYIGDGSWFISFTEFRNLAGLPGVALVDVQQDINARNLERVPERTDVTDGRIPADPGDFYAELDEYALRGVDLDALDSVFDRNAEFSQFIKNHSGVRLFRDGFGIRPYGLDGRDWLNLGGGQTSGRSFYGLRPQNVIGYVALTEENNRQLREKTDREGLIGSPYSTNFFRLLDVAVDIVNVAYNNLRRSYNEFKRIRSEEETGFQSFDRPLNDMRSASVSAEKIKQQTANLERSIDSVSASVRVVTDRVSKEPLFASKEENELAPLLQDVNSTLAQARELVLELQILLPKAQRLGEIADYLEPKIAALESQLEEFSELAALGLTAEVLSHEIHTVADRLAEQTRIAIEATRRQGIRSVEIIAYSEYVLSAVTTLKKQLSHLSPSLRYARETKDIISLQSFLVDLQGFYQDRFRDNGISIILHEPFDDFLLFINRGRLTQIVDNMVLNSEYWLNEAVRTGSIKNPTIIASATKPYLRIEDNGLGVDPSVERTIFQPFVTMKPRNQGRGLGLFIVQQLLDGVGGSVSLLPRRNQHGRRYIFQLDLSGVIHES